MCYSYRLLYLPLLLLFLPACETALEGNLNENMPPSTFLTVDEINLEDENRLSSQINISWWGNDPDGFIKGFEVAVGDTSNAEWLFTNRTDSTFLLPITPGQGFDDVLFSVRAVDNDDARDPEPASIIFPIKNTPPLVEFNLQELPPDTTFTITSFGWTVDDPDGRQNLLSTEIAFNDTTEQSWIEISLPDDNTNELFITLLINDEGQELATAEILLGRNLRSSELIAENIRTNAVNKFFVRTTDRADAKSEVISTEWFIKRQTSNILVLNDDNSFSSASSFQFHTQALQNLGLDFDFWIINDGSADSGRKVRLSSEFPSVINPTLRLILSQWEYIYWFSNDINRNITFAQDILSDFFSNGGRLFATIPMTSLPDDDLIFSFLPVDQLVPLPELSTSFLLQNGAEVSPRFDGPLLEVNQRLTTIVPMQPIGSATAIYDADFRVRRFDGSTREFDGVETISMINSERNFIFFGMDLQTVNANNNIDALLQQLLINELGFGQ